VPDSITGETYGIRVEFIMNFQANNVSDALPDTSVHSAAPKKNRKKRQRASGGGPNTLTKEHRIILRALEAANIGLSRVITVQEIALAISEDDAKYLRKRYTSKLSLVISKVLDLLRKRGLVFSPGKITSKRYYGSASAIDPATSPLPDDKSRRARVLELVRRVITEKKLGSNR
jgi:hypothetical protein